MTSPTLDREVTLNARLDDMHEEAHRAAAFGICRDFAARLQRELDAEPDAATTAVYERILSAAG